MNLIGDFPENPRSRQTRSGYTLVEVIVAMAIIGIMVVSLYAGFSSGFAILRTSREKSRATQVLLQKIEAVRFCTWSQLDAFPREFQEPFDPQATNGNAPALYFGIVSFAAPAM